MQGRVALQPVFDIGAGPGQQESLNDALVPLFAGQVQRCLSQFVRAVNVRTQFAYQYLCYVDLALLVSKVQGSYAYGICTEIHQVNSAQVLDIREALDSFCIANFAGF